MAILQTQSGTQLKQNYDILSVDTSSIGTQTIINNLKDYVAAGGVILITNGNVSSNTNFVFNQFGNTGNMVGNGAVSNITASSTQNLSSVFGNTLGAGIVVEVTGTAYMNVNVNQLAPGSRVIATYNSSANRVFMFTSEGVYNGNIVWVVDANIFYSPQQISGNIDNNNERFFHNMIAYLLQKAGL